MRLGVVSDTHGHVPNTQRAVRLLESLDVRHVVHCGDIGSPEIPGLFAGFEAHFVFGNVDDDQDRLRAAIERASLTCHERFGELTLAGVNIAFLHGDDGARLAKTIADGHWQLVCSGHTHLRRQQRIGAVWSLNPGALQRANPHTIAVVELPQLDIASIVLD